MIRWSPTVFGLRPLRASDKIALFSARYFHVMVGVAQLVRAPDCGSGGRGFETRHSPHFPFLRSSAKRQ